MKKKLKYFPPGIFDVKFVNFENEFASFYDKFENDISAISFL